MKLKIYIISILVLCLAVPPTFLGSLATIVNAASLHAAPIAYDQTVTTVTSYYTPIELTAYDADGDELTFLVADLPHHGTLYDAPPFVTYQSEPGFTGTDSFTFVAQDAFGESNIATVTINVRSNTDPVAYSQTVTTVTSYYTPIELTAYDADGDELTFLVADLPHHGTLYDAPPFVTYQSEPGFTGTDSFTFVAQDAFGESNIATVTINVRSNTDPVAYSQTVTTVTSYYTPIELTAYDADGDELTFLVADLPHHGTLYDAPPFVTYQSEPGFTGTDSFTFVAQDAFGESNIATVTINVRSNTDPVAYSQTVTTVTSYYTPIELTAYDADGDELTFLVADLPHHGTLYDAPPFVTYQSEPGFTGTDSFTFVAQDAFGESNIATVTINVRSNTNPVADPQEVEAISAVPLAITLTGSDADGDVLTFLVATDPAHGELTGSGANLIYTSDEDYTGLDFFEFVVQDGFGESPAARVDINVIHANRAPVADPQTLNASSGVPLALVLTGTDPDGDILTFQVTDLPDHGTLTGTAPNLTYTSTAGYVGADSFQFTVSDGTLVSDPATVSITVSASGPVTVFFDNFETNLGWVRNPNGTDTARTGMWERANPEYTWWMGPKQLGSTVSGYNDLVTGARAGWEAGSYDIDYGVTSIKSPSIVLPANSSLTLTFSYYLAHASNSSSADFLRVKVVGSSTTTVLQVLGTNKDKDAYWFSANIDLSAFAGQTVYILIEAADNSGASLVEAAVDDVKIIATPMFIAGGTTTNSK